MIYGIDVSKHNTVTDWNAVKASGKKFVFIRLGWANSDGSITKDEKFEEHYTGARAVGLDVGVFVYSYIGDSKYSRAAARNTIKMLEGRMITYPVAFDFEEYKISAKLSKSANTDICYEFLSEIQRLGYFAMMYTYTSFVQSYLNIERLKPFALWIADYRDPTGTNCPYKDTWGIWQYKGNTGKCDGVSGACDLNMSKYDYAATIKAKKLNGLDKVKVEKPNKVVTNTKYLVEYNKEQTVGVKDYNLLSQGDLLLSPHFQVKEFKSPDSSTVKIDSRLIWVLERLFNDLNCSKMIINSGYRTTLHDKKVGGDGKGFHTKGQAADIKAYGKDGKVISAKIVCQKLCDYGDVFGIGYINAESVHVDTRSKVNIWYGDETKGVSLIKQGYKDFDSYFNPKKTLTINAGTWNIRQSPNTASKIVCVVKGNSSYEYTAQMNGWRFVKDLNGWISPKGHTVNN